MSIDNQPQIGGFPARTASSSVPSRPAVATLPPPDPRAAVSIRGLYKRFDRKIAVNGLSLDIPVGSFFGLVGPNGAGKTTTLNMVTGLLVPDAGTAMILGQDVWQDVNAAKREIGVMPQPDQIFDRLTGMQLLIYSGMLRGMKRDVAHSRAGDLLNAFDLVSAADTMVSDYSAGMTKKICLASAMIHSPRILVLDEPFESVDPVSSANLKDGMAARMRLSLVIFPSLTGTLRSSRKTTVFPCRSRSDMRRTFIVLLLKKRLRYRVSNTEAMPQNAASCKRTALIRKPYAACTGP